MTSRYGSCATSVRSCSMRPVGAVGAATSRPRRISPPRRISLSRVSRSRRISRGGRAIGRWRLQLVGSLGPRPRAHRGTPRRPHHHRSRRRPDRRSAHPAGRRRPPPLRRQRRAGGAAARRAHPHDRVPGERHPASSRCATAMAISSGACASHADGRELVLIDNRFDDDRPPVDPLRRAAAGDRHPATISISSTSEARRARTSAARCLRRPSRSSSGATRSTRCCRTRRCAPIRRASTSTPSPSISAALRSATTRCRLCSASARSWKR